MKALVLILTAAALGCHGQETYAGSRDLDAVILDSIRNKELPGAVLLVSHQGRIIHRKAYGDKSLEPSRSPMTLDTIFDAASVTKVVATTASLMKLFEQGKFRLNDRLTLHIPEYQNGKSNITIRQLMTHFSGLRPDLDLRPAWSGYETGIQKAFVDKPIADPGERFIYSDINYILLGELVRRLSGKPLDEFAKENIFDPLEMRDTMFRPPASLRPRIAPTEHYAGMPGPLLGVVHDETTRYMGGVAGHAGLFTTADDLHRFALMILNLGEWNGARIFSPLTVRKFTEPQTPPDQTILRGFGFDIDSQFSSNRGELFPIGSFGHTGFTGTSFWIDPATRTIVILLANSVHPQRRPAISPLRSKVATIVAASLGVDAPGVTLTGYNETMVGAGGRRNVTRAGRAMNGLDVLAARNFVTFRGKRVGLITNHTGLSQDGQRNVDLMKAAGVNLVALFSPEHGITGKEDHENVADARDAASGVPIYSLYNGETRSPNSDMLRNVDLLVFDIQDIGARFYTYGCTMLNAMEAASKLNLPFYVLDRPNPITGVHVEGPVLEPELESFVGCFPMPIRHGMTIGELARMFHGERKFSNRLEVIPMKHWLRGDWLDSTGVLWVDPSPNIRSLNAALLYPGVALLEYSRNYSVGRGTDAPFEQVGAEWINGRELAQKLNQREIPGVSVYPTRFTPNDSVLKGVRCHGVRFVITDRERFDSVRFGLELASALQALYPGKIDFARGERLIGSRKTIQAIQEGVDPRVILQSQEEELRKFLDIRAKYLLYR